MENLTKSLTNDTLRRWISEMLYQASINISAYKAHSTRCTSSSKSLNQGLNLQRILNKGSWKSERSLGNIISCR